MSEPVNHEELYFTVVGFAAILSGLAAVFGRDIAPLLLAAGLVFLVRAIWYHELSSGDEAQPKKDVKC